MVTSTRLHASPGSSSFQELFSSWDLHLLLLRPPALISPPETNTLKKGSEQRCYPNVTSSSWMAFPATNKMQAEGTHLSCMLTAILGMDRALGVAPFSPTCTLLPQPVSTAYSSVLFIADILQKSKIHSFTFFHPSLFPQHFFSNLSQ